MSNTIDASAYIRNVKAGDTFSTWFDQTFVSFENKYVKVFRGFLERICRDAWDRCNSIWMGRYKKIINDVTDAIELCSCDDSTCESCRILKSVLLMDYR